MPIVPVKEIMKDYGKTENDSGSAEVQVAILTHRITTISTHLQEHKKDNHSRFGLLQLVGKRRKLLKYIQNKDKKAYKDLIAKLGLRK